MQQLTCFGMSDWDQIELRIESLAARATNCGWTLRRGEFVEPTYRSCCLLGALVIAEAAAQPQTVGTAIAIVGDEVVASALEAGFEGWKIVEAEKAPEAYAIGQRLCRRYGADPLHPHCGAV
jgi:hypothetical protein